MWSAWILTLRCRNISECSYPVHTSSHASRISASHSHPFHGRVDRELTTLYPCPGRRAGFLPPQAMRTRPRSICGSKHLVCLRSIFHLSNGTNFASRFYLALFWYLDLPDPAPRHPLRKTPQKSRPREDTRNWWFGPS